MIRVGEALRQTSKGKLQYSRDVEGKVLRDLLEECASPPALSSFHKEAPSPKSHLSSSFGLVPSPEDGDRPGLGGGSEEKGNLDEREKEGTDLTHCRGRADKSEASAEWPADAADKIAKSPTGQASSESFDQDLVGHLTTQFTQRLHVVHNVEREWDNKSKDFMQRKLEEFQKHEQMVASQQQAGLVDVLQRNLYHAQNQQSLLERQHLSQKEEINQAVQKLKESHSERLLRQDATIKNVEKLEQQVKKELERREHEQEQKKADIKLLAKSVGETKTALMAVLDGCPYKQYLSEAAEKTRLLMRKLAEQAELLAGTAEKNGPLDEIAQKLEHLQEQSQNALDFVNSLTGEAEKKAKATEAAEKQKQQQQQQQQQQASQGQSQGQGPAAGAGGAATASSQSAPAGQEGALAAVCKEYEQNKKLLVQMDSILQTFVGNQQMKKLRFDLQRAVNTPLNAISPVSSSHLRDKLQRLRALLQGQTVEVSGKRVNPNDVPEGIMFCKNLTAKMIARKAEEQVSSSHESAFAIAAVAVGLWVEFPDVGELLMCHLQALCPYVLPFMPPRLPEQSSADYHRSLGYKVEDDGTIEPQDKYLRRMSGLVRLYAAILVTAPPQGPNHPHPHGIEYAWIWLARTLNLKPDPDITATAIFDMLQVTGNFLLRSYRVQFVKLIYSLYKTFLPKLKEVAAGSGPVSRLETFLETTMRKSGMIEQPEGYLAPHFWYS